MCTQVAAGASRPSAVSTGTPSCAAACLVALTCALGQPVQVGIVSLCMCTLSIPPSCRQSGGDLNQRPKDNERLSLTDAHRSRFRVTCAASASLHSASSSRSAAARSLAFRAAPLLVAATSAASCSRSLGIGASRMPSVRSRRSHRRWSAGSCKCHVPPLDYTA